MKNKTQIKQTINGEVIYFKERKKATKIGSSCHIILPIEMLGKEVEVLYKKNETKKKTNN